MSDNSGTIKNNNPVWQSEVTHPEICNNLREGLNDVKDPEIGLSIIQLGLIRDVTIQDNHVLIKMILTTPYCPYGPTMLENTRKKAEETINMDVSIDFSLEPWDFSMMDEESSGDWGSWGIF